MGLITDDKLIYGINLQDKLWDYLKNNGSFMGRATILQ